MTLTLSKNLRRLALATALIQGVAFTAPGLYATSATLLQDWALLHWFAGTTVAEKLVGWLKTQGAQNEIWGWLAQFSQLAVILFLLSLLRDSGEASKGAEGRSPFLKNAAKIATIAAGIAVILNVTGQVTAAIEFAKRRDEISMFGGSTPAQLILLNAFHGIPEVCRAIVPLIIYRSQIPPTAGEPRRVPQSQHPGEC